MEEASSYQQDDLLNKSSNHLLCTTTPEPSTSSSETGSRQRNPAFNNNSCSISSQEDQGTPLRRRRATFILNELQSRLQDEAHSVTSFIQTMEPSKADDATLQSSLFRTAKNRFTKFYVNEDDEDDDSRDSRENDGYNNIEMYHLPPLVRKIRCGLLIPNNNNN